MNDSQRQLVIVTLGVIGLVLAFLMLEWGDGWHPYQGIPILVFYEAPNPRHMNLTDRFGIYTRHGIPGVLLGVVAPLSLFATAIFIALGRRKQ